MYREKADSPYIPLHQGDIHGADHSRRSVRRKSRCDDQFEFALDLDAGRPQETMERNAP